MFHHIRAYVRLPALFELELLDSNTLRRRKTDGFEEGFRERRAKTAVAQVQDTGTLAAIDEERQWRQPFPLARCQKVRSRTQRSRHVRRLSVKHRRALRTDPLSTPAFTFATVNIEEATA
eukprot:SAG11_NODE_9080_length_946_cov_1.342385_1_plen_119_part_10